MQTYMHVYIHIYTHIHTHICKTTFNKNLKKKNVVEISILRIQNMMMFAAFTKKIKNVVWYT